MERQKLTDLESEGQPGADVQVDKEVPNIEKLKVRLEQQKATKIKAEQIVSTLSKIKAREKASRRSLRNSNEKKNEDSSNLTPPVSTKKSTAQSNIQKEKSNLLKRKLEEERAKFESQREHEDLGRVSEIVEHLRIQLEDRDKAIQQIHSNLASTPKHTPQHQTESPSNEPEIPPEIKQRILDLEAKILDLQENLKEKDSVISARTQAITLLSEDMARKGKNTLDTLEETRSQMKEMQANFSTLEERMNEERIRLQEELADRKLKHQQAEKNFRAAEAARFTLSTKVAELQEKVVAMQTKNISFEEELAESNDKVKEMKAAMDAANKQTITMKAQFKAKLKALEKERDALKKSGDENAELNLLKERIADLEDEKGNLQLLLVDFDEIQETAKLLKERIGEMEEKLIRQENDLDNHVKVIAMLEAEKLDLVQDEKERSILIKEQEKIIESLRQNILELEGNKVSAEMKCVELEEKLDLLIKENVETQSLRSELENAKSLLYEQQSSIANLKQKLEVRQSALVDLQDPPLDTHIQDTTSDLQEWKLKYEDLEVKLNLALSRCDEWESRANALQNENTNLLQECEKLKIVIQKFENSIVIPPQSNENLVPGLKEDFIKKESELNNVLDNKESEMFLLQKELESTRTELQQLTSSLENVNEDRRKLEELTSVIEIKDKMLQETTNKLNEVSKKLSEYKKFHKLKSEDVLKISQELETISVSSQNKIEELEKQLERAKEVEDGLRKELEQKNTNGSQKKPDELTQKLKKLAVSLKLKTKAVKEFEEKITKIETVLEEKDKVVIELENSRTELLNTLSEKKVEISEKENLITELTRINNELKESKTSELDKSEIDDKIRQLEYKNAQLQEALNGNYLLIEQLNEDLLETRSMNNSLIIQFDNMQKSYNDEEVKTKLILDQFDSEMLGNKQEIDKLVEQLSESTRKYDQAWAKLQEKDAYIENMEQELENVRTKMLQIQTALNERQERFELTAEELGNRLQEAEIAKETSKQHEDELEHQIARLIAAEINLRTKLEEITFGNNELQKSLIEAHEKNHNQLQELNEEKNKVKELRKHLEEINDKLSKTNDSEELVDQLTREIKELKGKLENQVRELEEREKISLYNFETEINRLSEHIRVIESERNKFAENYENLTVENYNLHEEIQRLKEVINQENKLYVEKLEQAKIDFERAQCIANEENLEKINKILEEHSIHVENLKMSFMNNERSYCMNIENIDTLNKTLESELNQLRQQYSEAQNSVSSSQQEIAHLHELLIQERNKNETLRSDFIKEKAKTQIQNIVSVAEEKVNEIGKPDKADGMNFFKWNDESGVIDCNVFNVPQSVVEEHPVIKESEIKEQIQDLENRLYVSTCERERLELRVKELESRISVGSEVKMGSDLEDWPVNKEEEDGWGFTDAILEAEHIQKKKQSSDIVDSKIIELQAKLKESEIEQSKLSEELKASQVKCGKLMKKAKEFKIKLDEVGKSRSVGFDDLNFAMQQELQAQIEILEKTSKETKTELNTMKVEKESLLKRIDTLTSGNERLVDLKERQDIEVEMWKKRSNDLSNQIQALEWKIEELMSEQHMPREGEVVDEERQQFIQNAMEMEEKLNSIATENEYLIRVLGEARDQQKKQESTQVLNERIDELLNENEILNDKLEILEKGNNNAAQMNNEIEWLRSENHKLNSILDNMNAKITTQYKELDHTVEISNKIDIILKENERLLSIINNVNEEITSLRKEIEECRLKEIETNETKKEKELLNEVIRDLNCQLNNATIGFENQFKEIAINHQIEIDRLSAENIKLLKELETLNITLEKQSSVINGLQSNLSISGSQKMLNLEEKSVRKQETESDPVLFHGFTDTSGDFIDKPNNDKDVKSLKEQISILNKLLGEKENELEAMKQYVECSNICKENLQDEFHDRVKQIQNESAAAHELDISEVTLLREDITSLNSLVQSKDHELEELKRAVEQLKVDRKRDVELNENVSIQETNMNDANQFKENLNKLNLLVQSKDAELDELKVALEQIKIDKEKMQEEFMRKIEESKIQSEMPSFSRFSVVPEVLSVESDQLTEQVALLSRLLEEKEKEIGNLKCNIKACHSNEQSRGIQIQESFQVSSDPPAFRGFATTGIDDNAFPVQKLSAQNISEQQIHPQDKQNKLEQLQNEITILKEKEQKKIEKYRNEIRVLKDENCLLNKLLQEKETELELMKQQVECSKVEKENLQDVFADKILEIETHKGVEHSEVQGALEDKKQHPSEVIASLYEEISELKNLLQFKENSINMLTLQNQQIVFTKDSMLLKLEEEVRDYKLKIECDANEIDRLKAEVEDYNVAVVNELDNKYQSELANLHNELSTKDQQLMNSVNDLHNIKKDNELLEMRLRNAENKNEIFGSENETLQEQLYVANQQLVSVEEMLKENAHKMENVIMAAVENLEERLLKVESSYKNALSELKKKQDILSDLEGKFEEQNLLQNEISLSREKIRKLEEELIEYKNTDKDTVNNLVLQLKTKEAEVENFKHERSEEKLTRSDLEMPLSDTSNEVHYQEIIRHRDSEIAKLSETLSHFQETLTRKEEGRLNNSEEVLRTRLDEALYTLHLRDVRCDELTLELMQLLEERDTLQLRLSTAIRMNEELKGKHKAPSDTLPVSSPEDDISEKLKTTNMDENFYKLNEKLGQLHNVGYRKDLAVQIDRERRHNEQMHLYSQHSTREDDASSGFFNWMFGTSSSSSSQDV